MKAGWEVKSLGEVCNVKGGKRVPRGYKLKDTPTDYPYLSVADFSDDGSISREKLRYVDRDIFEQIKNYTISSKDLYLSIAGTIGKTGIVPDDLCGASLTENACKLVLGSKLNLEFLHYLTRSAGFLDATSKNTRTSAQPKLSLNRLKSIQIPIPPLKEQKRIVAVLDAAFEGLTRAKDNAEANLQNARELFENTELGLFHKHTSNIKETNLGDFADFRNGLNFSRNSKGQTIKIVGVGDFQDHFWMPLEHLKSVTIEGQLADQDMIAQSDILAVRSNGNKELIGRVMLADVVEQPTSFSGFTIRIRLKSDEVSPEYVCCFMKTKAMRKLLTAGGDGANISNLNQVLLSKLIMRVPSMAIQRQVIEEARALRASLDDLLVVYRSKLSDIANLRQSLLQKAFAGELT